MTLTRSSIRVWKHVRVRQFCRESVIFLLIGLDWLWFKNILVFVTRSSLRFQAVSNQGKTASLQQKELFVTFLVTAPHSTGLEQLSVCVFAVLARCGHASEGRSHAPIGLHRDFRVVFRCFYAGFGVAYFSARFLEELAAPVA